MFKAQSIEELQTAFFRQLAEQNSALTDIAPGSILYTLGRSFAGVHAEQEFMLAQTAANLFINSAIGSSLDELASNYTLTRKLGEFATGSVLAITNEGNATVAGGTILTDIKTGLQFLVQGTNTIELTSFLESKLNIISAKRGREYNLKAGAKLISPTLPTVTFIVGSHRTTSGEVCGDLKNGIAQESDESFRQRLISYILNRRSTTENAIKASLLSAPQVAWVTLKTPLPGVLQVWIDSAHVLTIQELNKLKDLANQVRAAGIVLELKQATRQLVDLNLYVLPNPQADLDELTKTLISTIESYLLSLNLGQSLLTADLKKQLAALNNVVQLNLLTPASDIAPSAASNILRAGNILITYDAA